MVHSILRISKLCLFGGWYLFCAVGSMAAAEKTIVTYDFETANDIPAFFLGEKPDGMGETGNSTPAIVEQKVVAVAPAVSGKKCLSITLKFFRNGWAAPTFYLGKPLPVQGPLYLSGYIKMVEQDSEFAEKPFLLVWGEYPSDPYPVLGKIRSRTVSADSEARVPRVYKGYEMRTGHSKEMKDGWIYFYSEDIYPDMLKKTKEGMSEDGKKVELTADGMCLTAISLFLTATPRMPMKLLVDNIRITEDNPLPPLTDKEKKQAFGDYSHYAAEFHALADRISDTSEREKTQILAGEIKRLHDQAMRTKADTDISLFDDKTVEMQKQYWRLKVREITGTL